MGHGSNRSLLQDLGLAQIRRLRRYIGIANLLLNEAVYPEFIQGAAQPERLGRELRECIHNPDRQRRTAELAAKLRGILHQPTSGSAADWVLKCLG